MYSKITDLIKQMYCICFAQLRTVCSNFVPIIWTQSSVGKKDFRWMLMVLYVVLISFKMLCFPCATNIKASIACQSKCWHYNKRGTYRSAATFLKMSTVSDLFGNVWIPVSGYTEIRKQVHVPYSDPSVICGWHWLLIKMNIISWVFGASYSVAISPIPIRGMWQSSSSDFRLNVQTYQLPSLT